MDFTPTAADMEFEHDGLLVSSLGEDSGDGYIVTGRNVTARRALAALSAYARHTDHTLLASIREDLRDGLLTLAIHPTRFTRGAEGRWTAHRTAGYPATAWIS